MDCVFKKIDHYGEKIFLKKNIRLNSQPIKYELMK